MKKASIRKSALKIVAVLVVLVAVAAAAFFRSKPMLDPADSPRISLITADYENGGESYRSTMEQTDISQNLNNQLIALFQGTQMRNVRFLRPQSFRMEPDSVYLNVWVETDRGSMLVNLSTNSDYNSAQFGDTHYAIVNGPDLYQKVYELLSPLLVAHGSPWSSTEPPTPTPAPTPTMTPPPEEPEGPPSQLPERVWSFTDPDQVSQERFSYSQAEQDAAVAAVRNELEQEAEQEYTISLTIGEITPSPSETAWQWKHYFCPESELFADWTEEDMLTRFMVVSAQYDVEYDNTKTFMNSGKVTQNFFLTKEDGVWSVWDRQSPDVT